MPPEDYDVGAGEAIMIVAKRLCRVFFVATVFALSAGCVCYLAIPLQRTELSHLNAASAEFWSDDGRLLHVRPNRAGSRCMWRPLSDLSPAAAEALIASEDRGFYSHHGVDWLAMLRAGKDRLLGGPRSGASTITMQLARLLFPHKRGLRGKIVEVILAVRLERTLTKNEIIEEYLNRLPLGRGLDGVEAASWSYFGHAAASLTRSAVRAS